MKREDKIKSMEKEYRMLTAELPALRARIRNEWTTASVQTMRELEGKIGEDEARIAAIQKSEAYLSFRDKK